MALKRARFGSDDVYGILLFDPITVYVYPMVFRSDKEIEDFLRWFNREYKVSFNAYEGDHYAAYNLWKCSTPV